MKTKFTSVNIKVGRGTAVHYAWKTNRNGEEIEHLHTFCGQDGAGGGSKGYDTGISGIAESPVTCKKCLKAMEYAQSVIAEEENETV